MADYDYQAIVVGTGPGGEGAAMQLAKDGCSVAVVERMREYGGACTHLGTIPSKALRYTIGQMTESLRNPLLRDRVRMDLSFPEARQAARDVVGQQVSMRRGFYERNRVPVHGGEARFIDPHTVEVAGKAISAEHFVLATGSRPFRPDNIDFSHPRILDSDTVLDMDLTPRSITIYGAGVVGLEYASIFRNLGIKVNLINTREKLLDFLDDEIIDALSYWLREQGVVIRHREEYQSIEGTDDGVILVLKSGKQIKSDVLLWANGRSGNTESLQLENVGLEANRRGQISVNQNFQTQVPHIHAVGDVIGIPSLASAAYVQGRAAARNIVDPENAFIPTDIPTGIYTSPEISSVGKTERELTESRVPYEVGQATFKQLARAQITGRTVGVLKILFHRETLEILGVHCFGSNASEIIHIGQAIMAQEGPANSLLYFLDSTFNYPTMAEAYRVAALNGHNRLF